MGRKLASIQVVWDVNPIDGADNLELANVLGWKCVVPKGEYKKYDKAVYFEIDSFLPVEPRFEFLRKTSFRHSDLLGDGFKLRTIKLRGQLSQGLLMPLSEFPELPEDVVAGQDVTGLLGVRKWEIEERASTNGTIIGNLPYGVPHTDETRVQSDPSLIRDFKGHRYYITTKLDGSSHSVSLDKDGTFHVCGHNYEYKNDGKCSFWKYVLDHRIEEKVRGFVECPSDFYQGNKIESIVIQGEFCAPGIAGNRLKLQKPEWFVFTIVVNGKRLGFNDTFAYIDSMGLTPVPVEETGVGLEELYPTPEALLERADGYYEGGTKKEGIVVRTIEPVKTDKTESGYLSIKAVSNKYLLKNEE